MIILMNVLPVMIMMVRIIVVMMMKIDSVIDFVFEIIFWAVVDYASFY